ncbi:hypothetical protein H5410_028178 [Solanum commersonii]|uniref:Nuclear factor related to kappa-B-binding protein second winged helix domain-containing protein n=1 Tax=Solanum commersonii TaxID=4109 RepID=A0A9J5Z6R0_SOLCO|nr:hypothetical protein H5410_028178 [Solanum commersonii]
MHSNLNDHFSMIKNAVTILPRGDGTRDDNCVLVMDLQFIVEDISDSQINKALIQVLDHLYSVNDMSIKYEKE